MIELSNGNGATKKNNIIRLTYPRSQSLIIIGLEGKERQACKDELWERLQPEFEDIRKRNNAKARARRKKDA